MADRNLTLRLVVALGLLASACGASPTQDVGTGAAVATTPTALPTPTLQPPEPEPTVGPTESPTVTPTAAPEVNPACVPSADVASTGIPPSSEDRRFEDISTLLYGDHRDKVAQEHPNHGGLYGDRRGGVVVAVLDCGLVDADELARLAGGPEYLHLIEVPYTFVEINAFRDQLLAEIQALGIDGSTPIDSTLQGRIINVWVEDLSALPLDFGSGVPTGVFTVSGPEPVTEEPSIPRIDDGLMVDCLYPVAYTNLIDPQPADEADPAFIEMLAWIDRNGAEFGALPSEGWVIFHSDAERRVFGLAPGPEGTAQAMQLERNDAGWFWSGYAAGECNLRAVLPRDVARVEWDLVDASGTSVTVLAREWPCDEDDLAGRLRDPLVEEGDSEILIGLVADASPDAGRSCPLDERQWTEVVIDLDAPVGDRQVRDAFVLPDPFR